VYREKLGKYCRCVLVSVSVGGQQLSLPSSAFEGGTVVDTGTVITRLPPTVYAVLRSAFRSGMVSYGYTSALSNGILDTCNNFAGYGC